MYDYLIYIGTKNFNPNVDRPKTSLSKDLKEISRPIEIQYFVYFIQILETDIEITAKDLFSKFQIFLKENYSGQKEYSSSCVKLLLKLKKLNIEGVNGPIHSKNGNKYIINHLSAKKWLVKSGYIEKIS